jgi:hypothetical protein
VLVGPAILFQVIRLVSLIAKRASDYKDKTIKRGRRAASFDRDVSGADSRRGVYGNPGRRIRV